MRDTTQGCLEHLTSCLTSSLLTYTLPVPELVTGGLMKWYNRITVKLVEE